MEDFNFRPNIQQRKLTTSSTNDSLSKRVLGLDWNLHLPITFTKVSNDITREFTIVPCSYDDGKDFLEDNAQVLFNEATFNHSFMMLEDSPNREGYYNHCVDHFAILCDNKIVGYASINMQDWSTYYLRYINVLPEYRGHKVVVNFVECVTSALNKFGITRIQADVSVNHQSQLAKLIRMGFLATGNTQCERWGSMLNLTKLLDEKAGKVFSKQYCLST